jgi:hypothetical protein
VQPNISLQRLLLSAHLAAGVATILLSVPVGLFLNRSEPVGVALTTVVLGLMYGILFLAYRAVGYATAEHADDARHDPWVVLAAGGALFLAGTTWATWVWLMDMSLASLRTYIPLLVGCFWLWCAFALGSLITDQGMGKCRSSTVSRGASVAARFNLVRR